MAELIKVGMADYKVGRAPATIISYGLGSCIGVSLYDPQAKVGGLLHIMLPDSTQSRSSENPAKFADTGVPLLLKDVLALGASKAHLVAKMAGGAQMFAFAKATDIMRVGERNANAVRDLLKSLGIRLLAEDTGQNYGRTVQINLENGVYTVKTMVKGERLADRILVLQAGRLLQDVPTAELLPQFDLLLELGIQPLEITEIINELNHRGDYAISPAIIDMETLAEYICRLKLKI